MESKVASLWKKYLKNRDLETRNQLVLEYIGLVGQIISKLPLPNHIVINYEDFKSVGIMALVDAIEKYEEIHGSKFETYAYTRIQGSIRDELRNFDLLTRTARKKVLDIYKTREELTRRHNREVTIDEIRNQLNLSEEQFKSYMQALDASNAFYSLSDTKRSINDEDEDFSDFIEEIPDPADESVLETMEKTQRRDFIYNYLQKLPRKKRLVLMFTYYEELTPKQISQILNISEGRISQIHSEVVRDLRKKLIELDYV